MKTCPICLCQIIASSCCCGDLTLGPLWEDLEDEDEARLRRDLRDPPEDEGEWISADEDQLTWYED